MAIAKSFSEYSAFEVKSVEKTVRDSWSVARMTEEEESNVGRGAPLAPHLHPRNPSLNFLGESCCLRICREVR